MVKNGEFLEWTVNHGKKYGTSFAAVREVLKTKNCLLDIDYKGSQSLKAAKLEEP